MTHELERLLAGRRHGSEGLTVIQAFLRGLPRDERLAWLAEHMLTSPLTHDEAQARVNGTIEQFRVLQGDVIRTSSAYSLGLRDDRYSTYVIATSSCDLVEGRRTTALLLPVQPRNRKDFATDAELASHLDSLATYRPKKHFYLPVLADDHPDVMYNVVLLDPLQVIANDQVNLAERRASLSLVGWRMFGALVRELLVREAEHEDLMRTLPISA